MPTSAEPPDVAASTPHAPDAAHPGAPPPPPADVVVPLCRAPLWRGGLNLVTVAALVLLCSSLADVLPKLATGQALDPESLFGLASCGVWAAVLTVFFGRRWYVRQFAMPPIRFAADGLHLPLGPESRRTGFVAYGDILTVGQADRPYVSAPWPGSAQAGNQVRPGAGDDAPKRGAGRTLRAWHHFFLESRRRTFSLPQPMFRDKDGHEVFFGELQRRIAALPQGAAALRTTQAQRQPVRQALSRRPLATQVLFGVSTVLFLNTWLKGALSTPFGLLRWGAMAPALVGQPSEMYRLLAATFLHGHWLHAVMNALALGYLGALLERLLGWVRMVLLYLVCGAVAMGCSAWAADALLSVGASGALFGLLGAYAVVSWRLGPALPLGVRQPWRWWASLLVINALVPKFWPVVDWVAHLSGFAAGVALALPLVGRRRGLPRPPGRALQAACAVVVALYAAALTQAVARAARTSALGETRVAELLLHDPRTPADTLHNFAWLWAIDPASTPEHLEAGRDCAAEALRRAPRVPEYRATLADLERRLGELGAASADWAQALADVLAQMPASAVGLQANDTMAALYAQQLGLTLAAHLPVPPAPAPPGPGGQAAAQAAPADAGAPVVVHAERDGRAWRMRWPQGGPQGAREVYLLGRNGADAVALVQVWLPADAAATWQLPAALRDVLEATGTQTLQLGTDPLRPLPPRDPAQASCPDGCWRAWRLPQRRQD